MIVNLEKYLIFGSRSEMDQFFSLAQRAGFLEFIDPAKKKKLDLPANIKTILSAIKIAKHYPTHSKEAPTTDLEIAEIAEMLVSYKKEQEALLEEETPKKITKKTTTKKKNKVDELLEDLGTGEKSDRVIKL